MSRTYRNVSDPQAEKQLALFKASDYIRSIMLSGKPFIDFDYVYGSGVLFRGLTREEVEELYNQMSK